MISEVSRPPTRVDAPASMRPYHAMIAAAALLPLLIFAVAAWQNWSQLVALAEDRADRRARIAAEHALKVFEANEQVLRRIAERVAGARPEEAAGSAAFAAYLDALADEIDHLEGAGIVGADGRLLAVNEIHPAPALDLSDRDYVIEAAEEPRSFVSRAAVGRLSGEALFRLSRRLEDGGVVFVSTDPDYFTAFYRTVTGGEDSITMARADGAVLAREPPVTTGVETLSPQSALMRAVAVADEGLYRTVSQLDGLERIHAYRRVGPYPVYVSYGFALARVEREWRGNLLTFGAVTGLAALGLVGLSVVVMRRARHERRVFADYRAEVERREEAEARLRQSQKMEALGQLTGGVAHDFNNLLTVVIGNLDMLQRRLGDASEREARLVAGALEGAQRAAALTHRLLAFARRQPLDPKPLDVNKLVSSMSELLRRSLGGSVAVETVLAGGLWRTIVDPNQLESALLNLAVNARDAMPNGGELTIETANAFLDEAYAASRHEVEPGQYVMISVSDTGVGMSREVAERAFEPFFTTKAVGKGTGLGLSQVYGFIKQSGGHAAVYSEPGQGTTVKLYLPRHRGEGPVHEPAAADPAAGTDGAGETILVVEDDERVRAFVVQALREAGYRVFEAGDGPGGLALVEAHPEIALLFTDVVLAGPMNGRALADAALARRPGLPVVFTTGYTRNAIIHQGRLDEGVDFLGKPFTATDLCRKIRAALSG